MRDLSVDVCLCTGSVYPQLEFTASLLLAAEKMCAGTLQRTNSENSKQIFPEKQLRSHSPNFQLHVSMSDLYIPTIDLSILLQQICGPILGIYKSLTNTWMWKLGLRPHNSQKRNTKMSFVAVQAIRAPIYKLSSIHAYPPSARLGRTPIKASTLAFRLIASCQQWMAI